MRYKKILIGVGIVLLVILLVNVGLNLWIKYQLPNIIHEENKSPHRITYDDISVSLLRQNILISDVNIVPKEATRDDKVKYKGLYATVKSVEVANFGLYDLIFSDKISASSLIVTEPNVTLYQLKIKEKEVDSVATRMNKIITVSDLYLHRGSLELIDFESKKRQFLGSNINFNLEGILVTEQTLKQKLPLTYRQYSLSCDSIFYSADKFYNLEATEFKTDERQASVKNVKLIPLYSRDSFSKAIDKESDLFAVSVDSTAIRDIIWGFKDEEFFCSAGSVNFIGLNANIYRDKTVRDDPKKKKLYSELLRNLDFDMKIDTLRMRNSKIVYEEAKNEYGAGKLSFSNFNLIATSVYSGFKKTKLPNVNIHIDCRFMNAARFETDWSFNVMNQAEAFNIKGRIYDLPLENMSAFTKPYLNAKTKGVIDRVYFNFSGNDNGAGGDFAIEYDDLKVEIFRKKDRKKKNKILSAIANLFVKNDTNEEVTTAEVAVTRDKQKSFFNLLWISLADGLKKILV